MWLPTGIFCLLLQIHSPAFSALLRVSRDQSGETAGFLWAHFWEATAGDLREGAGEVEAFLLPAPF